jgi:hypothetical protein
LTLNSQQPAARAAACRLRSAQPPKESSAAKAPAHAVIHERPSPPNREETLLRARRGGGARCKRAPDISADRSRLPGLA